MKYIIYKITNKFNGKYYIGKHQTKNINDDYFGSGKLLKHAIKKYGIENFVKEILFVYDNEQNMNNKEKELVVISEETYNLCEGGKGGFGYINKLELNIPNLKNASGMLGKKHTDKTKKILSEMHSGSKNPMHNKKHINYVCSMLGKKHTDETKQIMKTNNIGEKNSQYGSMWITDGYINTKIKACDTVPYGFRKGRITQLMKI